MNKHRFLSLLLCAALIVAVCSGCQKPMDAQTLVQKMEAAIGGRNVTATDTTMDLEMTIGMDGTSMDMSMNMVGKTCQSEDSSYSDMSMKIKMLGITQEVNGKTYISLEDGKYVSYVYSDVDDSWTRMEMPELDLNTGASVTAYEFLTEVAPDALVLDEEKQTLNDREVYVLRTTMTGEQMQQSFSASLEGVTEGLDEMTAGLLEGIDYTSTSAPTVFYIDAETFLPVKMEMEIQGLDQMMNSLFGTIIGSLGAELDMEDMDITVEIPVCTMVSDNISFDPVEVPAVPQEGIDAALANPLQPDGSYLLRTENGAVRITLPEGYTAMEYDEYYLGFIKDDYTVWGEYSTLCLDEADVLSYIDAAEQFSTEEGYFVSRSEVAQYGDFKTLQLNYTEDMVDYYAWRQLDGCMLDVMVSVMDPTANASLDALLDCVEVSAN